jgi:hypothetical protein
MAVVIVFSLGPFSKIKDLAFVFMRNPVGVCARAPSSMSTVILKDDIKKDLKYMNIYILAAVNIKMWYLGV